METIRTAWEAASAGLLRKRSQEEIVIVNAKRSVRRKYFFMELERNVDDEKTKCGKPKNGQCRTIAYE
jgi:hypothetical protein